MVSFVSDLQCIVHENRFTVLIPSIEFVQSISKEQLKIINKAARKRQNKENQLQASLKELD